MSKLKIHSKKAEVIEFSWEGTGTIPIVSMRWHNKRVKFECPIAMMEAYQELEKEVTRANGMSGELAKIIDRLKENE